MDKHQSKIIVIFCLIVSVIIVGFVLHPRSQMASPYMSPTPTLPAIPVALADTETSIEAPDGKFTLNMKQKNSSDSITYVFSTKDETTGAQKEIFTKTEPSGTTLSIPANTFSPDDKYIFLKEENSGQTDYFVVTPSGTLDISGPFTTKYPNLTITDVTGWGGINLIIVNTDKEDGSLGPSFWFEVPGGGFIQLSTRFN
jgi:hypothetical protein